jgi:hypothetical protein
VASTVEEDKEKERRRDQKQREKIKKKRTQESVAIGDALFPFLREAVVISQERADGDEGRGGLPLDLLLAPISPDPAGRGAGDDGGNDGDERRGDDGGGDDRRGLDDGCVDRAECLDADGHVPRVQHEHELVCDDREVFADTMWQVRFIQQACHPFCFFLCVRPFPLRER